MFSPHTPQFSPNQPFFHHPHITGLRTEDRRAPQDSSGTASPGTVAPARSAYAVRQQWKQVEAGNARDGREGDCAGTFRLWDYMTAFA